MLLSEQALALRAGLRISEALALSESELDPSRGAATIATVDAGSRSVSRRP